MSTKPSIDRPFWNAKVVASFEKGEELEAGDLLAYLQDVTDLVDYCHRDPSCSEYVVTRPFQIVVREG